MAAKTVHKNAEGYFDPTAGALFSKAEREEAFGVRKLLNTLFTICDMAGFRVEGRIVLVDKKTGKVWR